MDTGMIIGVVGAAIGLLGLGIGVAFGLDGRRSAKRIQAQLDGVLRAIRESRPEAGADLVAEAELPLPPDLAEQRARLARAIARLSEREKLYVTLRYYEELSDSQIADVLEVSPATVRALAFRVLKHLRELAEDGS